jgi:hypothetical protein
MNKTEKSIAKRIEEITQAFLKDAQLLGVLILDNGVSNSDHDWSLTLFRPEYMGTYVERYVTDDGTRFVTEICVAGLRWHSDKRVTIERARELMRKYKCDYRGSNWPGPFKELTR